MIISRTGGINGKPVREDKGIISGATIIGIKVNYETPVPATRMMMAVLPGTAAVI